MNKLDMPLECYPLPSDDESVVNERILGDCGHHDTFVRRSHSFGWMTRCRQCGWEIEFGSYADQRPGREEERKLWLRSQLRPGHGRLNSMPVEWRLKAIGWGISYMTRNGQTVCTLEKNGRRFSSRSHSDQAAALVDSAAQLARVLTVEKDLM